VKAGQDATARLDAFPMPGTAITQPPHPRPVPGAQGHAPLHRSAHDSGQRQRRLGARLVGPGTLVARLQAAATQELPYTPSDGREDLRHLGVAWGCCRSEREQVILATAPSSKAMSALIDGLARDGTLIVVGATFDPIEVTRIQLISGVRSVRGWAAGTPTDSEDTLRFAELTGVRPMIETYPLEKADEAYARMMSAMPSSASS